MDVDLDDLKRKMEAATAGPYWLTDLPWFTAGSGVMAGSPDPHVGYMIADCEAWEGERDEYFNNDGATKISDADADAAYIVAACNAVPHLLARVAELEAENGALRGQVFEAAEALEPFAKEAERCERQMPQAHWNAVVRPVLEIGELRTAARVRAALLPPAPETAHPVSAEADHG